MLTLARSRLGQRVCNATSVGVCKRTVATQPVHTIDTFENPDQMLRPPPKSSRLLKFHRTHFRASRFPTYDIDFTFKNTNSSVVADRVPQVGQNQFAYGATIKRKDENSSHTEIDYQAHAKAALEAGNKSDLSVKWFERAISNTHSAEEAEKLFETATKLDVVDDRLQSTYIYSLAMNGNAEKAVAEYERLVAAKPGSTDIHASGVVAYVKTMKGDKALELYNKFTHALGKKVPARVHASVLSYYFENGFSRQGFELHEKLEKDQISDTKITVALMRGYRLLGQVEKVQALFDGLKDKSVSAHCELVIAYGSKMDIKTAMRKLQEMKDQGIRPPHTLYNSIIRHMIKNGEMNNALMAIDMQFREGATPLDKAALVNITKYFANKEQDIKVKPKTEYAIWVGKKSGLYTDDLTYLTTPHYDLIGDSYYFRHHPEFDYPDVLKKSYQHKDFDEYPIYYPQDDRNPFAARLRDYKAPAGRTFRAELPSFSKTISLLNTHVVPEDFEVQKAEDQLIEYDDMVRGLLLAQAKREEAVKLAEQAKEAKELEIKAAEEAKEKVEREKKEAAERAEAKAKAAVEELEKKEEKLAKAKEDTLDLSLLENNVLDSQQILAEKVEEMNRLGLVPEVEELDELFVETQSKPEAGTFENTWMKVTFADRPDDSILPAEKRMPEDLRRELVQRARVERLISFVASNARLIYELNPNLLKGLDAARLREFMAACRKARENMKTEASELREVPERYLHMLYTKRHYNVAKKILRTRLNGEPVFRPLDFEDIKRSVMFENPIFELLRLHNAGVMKDVDQDVLLDEDEDEEADLERALTEDRVVEEKPNDTK